MLAEHLVRFPVRVRMAVVDYARPRLVDWKLPLGIPLDTTTEPHFGMVTGMKSRSNRTWGAVATLPFGLSGLLEWSVRINQFMIHAGITRCDHPWVLGTENESGEQVCLDVGIHFSGWSWYYAGQATLLDGTFLGRLEPAREHVRRSMLTDSAPGLIYVRDRAIRFAVDLAANIFSVSFDGHCVQSRVPDLASYRPFCYFNTTTTMGEPSASFY